MNESTELWAVVALCGGKVLFVNNTREAAEREQPCIKTPSAIVRMVPDTPPAQATAAPTDLGAAMRQIDDTLLYCKNKHAHVNGTRAKLVAARAVVASIIVSQPSAVPQAASLSVKLTEMHESNGNVTWSVLLAKSPEEQPWDCHTVYTDTIKGRAEYEADSLKHFLGLGPEPDMLEYDTDVPVAVPQDVTYELMQKDEQVAATSGSGAFQEILRYAAQYEQDGPIEIFKCVRTAIPATPSGEVPP